MGASFVVAVGDFVEAVPGAEGFELGFLFDEFANLIDRIGGGDAVGAELEVSGPIFKLFFWHGFEQWRDGRTRHHRGD